TLPTSKHFKRVTSAASNTTNVAPTTGVHASDRINSAIPGTNATINTTGITKINAAYNVGTSRWCAGRGGRAGFVFVARRAGEPAQVSPAGIRAPLGNSERSSSRA